MPLVSAPSLLLLPGVSLPSTFGWAVESALVGVGGPLLKMAPRVSSTSPSSENHLLGAAGLAEPDVTGRDCDEV